MKIAVYHNLPPGGALRVAQEHIERLKPHVQGVYCIAPAGSAAPPEATYSYSYSGRTLLGSPFGRLNGLINLANAHRIDRINRQIAADIDSQGYDAVVVHPCRATQTPSVLRYLKTPAVYYCHEPFRAMLEAVIRGAPWESARDPLRRLYERAAVESEYKAMKSATKFLCNSHFCRESIMHAYGLDATVNYLGVDTDVFRPQDVERDRYVLSVGRLSPLKAHDFVIEALGLLNSSIRPKLIIVGDGPAESRDSLLKMANSRGVDADVRSHLADNELARLYSGAICTAVSAILEPFGLVALESMACGTPVVGVAEGGIRETIIDEVTGFLTARDAAQFAGAVQRLVTDPELVASMGSASRANVLNNWSWDKSIAQLKSVIQEAAAIG